MKNRFSTDEWMQLVFLPLDTFTFIAGIDEEIEEAELEVFRNQLWDGPQLKNPLYREIMEDLARVERAIAEGRVAGVAPGLKVAFVSASGSGAVVMPEDHGDQWLDALQEAADRTRYGSKSAPKGGGGTLFAIMMPTGGLASPPSGFAFAKDLLKGTLNANEYEYFIAGVLYGAIEVARAGEEGPASISTEEKVALQAFCSFFEVGPEAIPRHYGS